MYEDNDNVKFSSCQLLKYKMFLLLNVWIECLIKIQIKKSLDVLIIRFTRSELICTSKKLQLYIYNFFSKQSYFLPY